MMREVNLNPGAMSPCVFHRSDVDGSALVNGGDFVIVTGRWHAKDFKKHLRSKREIVVQRKRQRQKWQQRR